MRSRHLKFRVRCRTRPARHIAALLVGSVVLSACATGLRPDSETGAQLRRTADLIGRVKTFGLTIGIEPTEALARTAGSGPPLSMLWLWMQRMGTIALQGPVDVRLAIGFHNERERLKLEQVYRVDGYSVYYRQGSEFADGRALATAGFAAEPIVRRVMVVLHEDLHGDVNFKLPWEIEEALVTPLSALAAAEFFRREGDAGLLEHALDRVAEERRLARELNDLAHTAERLFKSAPWEEASAAIFALMAQYPAYEQRFRRQTRGQHPSTALEAKLSHDLAYYRYFDRIAGLAALAPDLKTLVQDLKVIPADATHTVAEEVLRRLEIKYSAG